MRLDIVSMHDDDRIKKFSALIQSVSLSSDSSASRTEESIYQDALKSFGEKNHTNKNWFEENTNVLLLLIMIKQHAHFDYEHDPGSVRMPRKKTT